MEETNYLLIAYIVLYLMTYDASVPSLDGFWHVFL